MAPAGHLRPGEEDWRDVFERLCERFQAFAPDRVAQVLRECGGHAGQAASALRDLSGTAMRPVDPDDAEHVRTLLSSSVMFSHACKEHFRKFDTNCDGALDWREIVQLVNALYDDFGLQRPREGSLKAFFDATDDNHDGVLSEKEFKRFFEMFLRYAFFDVMNHKQMEAEATTSGSPKSDPSSGHRAGKEHRVGVRADRDRERDRDRDRDRERRRDDRERGDRDRRRASSTPQEAGHDSEKTAAHRSLCSYRCLAPTGVSFRQFPEYAKRMDTLIQQGQCVQVQEVWIKTAHGWLPVTSEQGEIYFEPFAGAGGKAKTGSSKHRRAVGAAGSPAPDAPAPAPVPAEPAAEPRPTPAERAPAVPVAEADRVQARAGPTPDVVAAERRPGGEAEGRRRARAQHGAPAGAVQADEAQGGGLRPGEEEWQCVFDRLSQRFPAASPADIAQSLRDAKGHAGQAANKLRHLTGTSG